MNKNVVIKVENLSKKYEIGSKNEAYKTLRDQLVNIPKKIFSKNKTKKKTFWALKNISFEVARGDVIGIIGKNGAGKSTLLKILSKIVEPTSGTITMKGRIASLLEVGTGFNAELTGRENIYLSGAIIGMTRKEIDQKFNSILDFSGIGKFIDTPVKRYSSGMYIRLAFSVAAHLDSDILLVDEVLSVGDAEFQKKCLGKMSDLSKSGRTVIFVSHNINAIKTLCPKAIYLASGKIVIFDNVTEVISEYINSSSVKENELVGPFSKQILINKISINNSSKAVSAISSADKIKISVFGISKKSFDKMKITLAVYKDDTRVFSTQDALAFKLLSKGKFTSKYTIPSNLLRPGDYSIYVGGVQEGTNKWFYGERMKSFKVIPDWSDRNQQINIGIINVPFTGERKQ